MSEEQKSPTLIDVLLQDVVMVGEPRGSAADERLRIALLMRQSLTNSTSKNLPVLTTGMMADALLGALGPAMRQVDRNGAFRIYSLLSQRASDDNISSMIILSVIAMFLKHCSELEREARQNAGASLM